MKHILTTAFVALVLAIPMVAQGLPSSSNKAVPMGSPEPLTMLALAGGAGAALGLSKRRKNKD
jgi:hypothetical protein